MASEQASGAVQVETAPSAYAIPEEGNAALQALLGKVAWPKGWGWYRANLRGFAAQVDLAHVPGMERARLSVAHRDVTLPTFADAKRAGVFALLVQVDPQVPGATSLEPELAKAFELHGGDFPWVHVLPEGATEPVPMPAPAPVVAKPVATDPVGDPTGDRTGDPPPGAETTKVTSGPSRQVVVDEPVPEAVPASEAIATLLALAGVTPGQKAEEKREVTKNSPPPWGTVVGPDAALEAELDRLMEVRPYLEIGVTFDPAQMLAEARALLPRYVAYQSDPTYGIQHWSGLALWGFDGDESRPAMPVGEGSKDGTRYRATAAAKECPATMAFLDRWLDLSQARTIAFLALMPHSEITAHTDDAMHEVTYSFNAALNMPEGCRFLVELEDDGREGPRTVQLPLTAGTALLVNVGKTHVFRNDSDELRIHLVARAPLKRPIADTVALARKQTGLETQEAQEAAVREVYAAHGWPPPQPLALGQRRKRHGT